MRKGGYNRLTFPLEEFIYISKSKSKEVRNACKADG
jgi:hypothetical protein